MQSPDYFEFYSKAKIISGSRALEHIPVELESYDAVKPLVISDKSATKDGLNKILTRSFFDSNVIIGALFDEVPEYASIDTVQDLAKIFRDRGCDSIIAIGSGAVVDVAKGVNILVSTKTDELFRYTGTDTVHEILKPLIYIPTAFSTGSEATNSAVIDKNIFTFDQIFPDIIIADPRITRGCCSECVAQAAMTALTHAVESSDSENYSPMNDAYAHAAIQFISENLMKGIKKPKNKQASLALANGAAMAAIAFSNSPAGRTHLLAERLAAATGHPAGQLMSIILPHSLEFKIKKKKKVRPELLLAVSGLDEYAETPAKDRPARAVAAVRGLQQITAGTLPASLQELNIPEYKLEAAAREVETISGKKFSAKDSLLILEHAHKGASMV